MTFTEVGAFESEGSPASRAQVLVMDCEDPDAAGERTAVTLGLATPITARLKLDLHDLIHLKLGWDERVPDEHGAVWTCAVWTCAVWACAV